MKYRNKECVTLPNRFIVPPKSECEILDWFPPDLARVRFRCLPGVEYDVKASELESFILDRTPSLGD